MVPPPIVHHWDTTALRRGDRIHREAFIEPQAPAGYRRATPGTSGAAPDAAFAKTAGTKKSVFTGSGSGTESFGGPV